MAKSSLIERNKKREKLSNSGNKRKKRAKLKELIRIGSPEEQESAGRELNKMKRDTSKVRTRTRCYCCGRPRAVYKKFGLCRICLRKSMMDGNIPGFRKSSW